MDRSGFALRLGYVGYLAAVAFCSGLAFVGVFSGDSVVLSAACAAGGLALGLRWILRGQPIGLEADGTGADEAFSLADKSERSLAAGAEPKVDELAALLQEWSGLERARGSGRFDPWALQSVRSEIRATVQENPALRRLLGTDV
jgi:hypothetical protein